jgi:transposase
MKYKHFVGVDVSKLTLDICLYEGSLFLMHERIENKKETILLLLKKLKSQYKVQGKTTIYCAENTGPYQNILISVLQTKKTNVWLESGLHIKKSLGIQRGKSDKIDSFRIARFAYLNCENPKLLEIPRSEILLLKKLSALRKRLKLVLARLQVPAKEDKAFISKELFSQINGLFEPSIEALKNDIVRTEAKMESVIENDAHLSYLMKLLQSVPGIGQVIALELIITTNEFKNFTSAKKLASFCGIAPFEYTSGTSLKGRPRVSNLANKQLKGLLHMAAIAAIKYDTELKQYYLRKVGQGKHKMNVMNILKNKIVHRAFACVRDGRPYEKRETGSVGPIVPTSTKISYPIQSS